MPIVECKCGKTISVSVADFQAGVEVKCPDCMKRRTKRGKMEKAGEVKSDKEKNFLAPDMVEGKKEERKPKKSGKREKKAEDKKDFIWKY